MAVIKSEQQHPEMVKSGEEEKLKYLDFVQVATLHALIYLSKVYNFAKENSGPLKTGVESVEGTVKTVIAPVYHKFHDVPYELLKFVDHKVNESITEVENHVPPMVKEVSGQAYSAAQLAPKVAQAMASEIQRAGLVETATGIAKTVYTKVEPTAKDAYAKYEPVAEQYAASAWRKLNQLPLFPQVARVMVPAAASVSDKYNSAVIYTAERGYTVSSYLPLVPKERIARVFSGRNGELEQPLLVSSDGSE